MTRIQEIINMALKLAVIFGILWYVWAGRYVYRCIPGTQDTSGIYIRTNLITDKTYYLTWGDEWQQVHIIHPKEKNYPFPVGPKE
jgi:hypothetical protein